MKNKDSTRYYSDLQEKYVCSIFDGKQTSNSGANKFEKGDIIIDRASMLMECKTTMSSKNSFSIKKDWLEKLKEESFRDRLDNFSICFNFEPNGKNYYVINESLMTFLLDRLEEYHRTIEGF